MTTNPSYMRACCRRLAMSACRCLSLVFVACFPLAGSAQVVLKPARSDKERAAPYGVLARIGNPQYLDRPGRGIALSPDGKLLATGVMSGLEAKPVVIHDANSGKFSRALDSSPAIWPAALAWSANGKRVAAISSSALLQVWDAAAGKALWPGRLREVDTVGASVSAIGFADEDRLLAIVGRPRQVSGPSWYVELWEVEAGKRKSTWSVDKNKQESLKALGVGYEFHHVVLSPSGERMAWLATPPPDKEGKSAVFLYETATGKLLHALKDLPRAYRMDLLDEAETLLLRPIRGARPLEEIVTGQATVINIANGRVVIQCDYRLKPYAFVNPYSKWTNNGKHVSIERTSVRFRDWLLVFDQVGMVRVDLKTGRKLDQYDEPFASFAISADGRRIAIRDGKRVGVSDGDLASLKTPGVPAREPFVRFLPDGRLLSWDAGDEEDGLLHVWDPRKRVLLETTRVNAWPSDYDSRASFNLSAKTLAFRSRAGQFVCYDLVSNKRLAAIEPPADGFNNQAFLSADGKRLLVIQSYKPGQAKDALVMRWYEARTGREIGHQDIPINQLPEQHLRAAGWYSDDGSAFGYVTPDRRLALVDCDQRKVVATIGITPSKEWKIPRWEYRSAGFGRLIWARPYVESYDNAAAAEHAIWDRAGRLLRRFTSPLPKRYADLVSPDGRTAALVQGHDVVLIETATGKVRGVIRCEGVDHLIWLGRWHFADFSPDGTVLAASDVSNVVLWDLARPLSKPVHARPTNVRQAEALGDKLGDPDPTESDRALWALVKAPDQALAMLKDRLKPDIADGRRIQALIKKLDSGNFADRDAAQKELRGMKESVLSLLRDARKGASLEQARRLDEVIVEMQGRLETPEAIRSNLRAIRALEALERINSAEARNVVEAVARGGDAVATFEAQLILARWPKAP